MVKTRKFPVIFIIVVSILCMAVGLFTELDSGMTVAALIGCIPSMILLVLIYRADSIEHEPLGLLIRLFFAGGFISCILAVIGEIIMENVIDLFFEQETILYLIVENFIGVALIEELSKYVSLKFLSWKKPAFNYRFDGVVYGVTTAIGFEVIENIEYIIQSEVGNLTTAFIRASFPGHAIFGIYMGYNYGQAKVLEKRGDKAGAKRMRIRGVIVATLIHGLYDFLCSFDTVIFLCAGVPLVILLNVFAYKNVKKYRSQDVPVEEPAAVEASADETTE